MTFTLHHEIAIAFKADGFAYGVGANVQVHATFETGDVEYIQARFLQILLSWDHRNLAKDVEPNDSLSYQEFLLRIQSEVCRLGLPLVKLRMHALPLNEIEVRGYV